MTIILTPALTASRKSLEVCLSPIVAITPFLWSNGEMVSCSCASRTVLSVTTMTLSKSGTSSLVCRDAKRYAVQAMVLDLPEPALC